MADEIREKFTGKWKLDRSENFEDFLSAMGACDHVVVVVVVGTHTSCLMVDLICHVAIYVNSTLPQISM